MEKIARIRRRSFSILLTVTVMPLLVLAACGSDPKDEKENLDPLRDAIISQDCDVTAEPPRGVSLDDLFLNETASTGDADTDAMIADYAQYWQRYYLALQTLDVPGSCVLVNSSSSKFRGEGFVAELKANKEHFEGSARLVSVKVTRFDEQDAELTACIDESQLRHVDENGAEISQSAGVVAIDSHLVLADGLWRVGSNEPNSSHTC